MGTLVVRGGTLITPNDVFRGDILIDGETISRIGQDIAEPAAQILDAEGCFVLPGLIDAHVHLRDPGATHKEDFFTGTCAALAGGVTTVLDMPNNPVPTTTQAALDGKRQIARAKAVCDYGLFVGATAENCSADVADWGAVGVKLYMGATTGDLLVTDLETTLRHFEQPHTMPIVVHAEDDEAVKLFSSQAQGGRHSVRRPPLSAALAVARALAIAQETGHPLHIAHLSTGAEIELVKEAKARGVHVTCEVTPHHLFLSTDDEERLGPYGAVNPPLRSPEDVRALWRNLEHCDLIATDHAPHTAEEKESGKPPSGMPGLETMLPLLLTAFGEKRLSLQDIARMTSRKPARVFHLARKGEIAPGYDADLALVRLDEEYVLGKPWKTKCNWSPFEGRRVRGKVVGVIRRGQVVVENQVILAKPGSGRGQPLVRTGTILARIPLGFSHTSKDAINR